MKCKSYRQNGGEMINIMLEFKLSLTFGIPPLRHARLGSILATIPPTKLTDHLRHQLDSQKKTPRPIPTVVTIPPYCVEPHNHFRAQQEYGWDIMLQKFSSYRQNGGDMTNLMPKLKQSLTVGGYPRRGMRVYEPSWPLNPQ